MYTLTDKGESRVGDGQAQGAERGEVWQSEIVSQLAIYQSGWISVPHIHIAIGFCSKHPMLRKVSLPCHLES